MQYDRQPNGRPSTEVLSAVENEADVGLVLGVCLISLAVASLIPAVARAENVGVVPFKATGIECGPVRRTPPFTRSIPPGAWSPLKPVQQGVLVVGDSPWGTHVQAVGPSYSFISGPSTPYFPYLWPDGREPKNQPVPAEVARVGAVALNPSAPNPFGLTRPAHLVEAQVNGGHGGMAQREFVLTGVRSLEGTSAFPSCRSSPIVREVAKAEACRSIVEVRRR